MKPTLGSLLVRLAAVGCLIGLGAGVTASAESYPTRIYTETDGLANSVVFDLDQGPDGRMWFATRGGVCVYDGVDWRVFGPEQELPRTTYYRLRVLDDGTAWVLSKRNARLHHFDGATWSLLPEPPGPGWTADAITDLAVVGAGGRSAAVVGTERGLWIWRDAAWRHVASPPVAGLAGRPGEVLVASTRGLLRLDLRAMSLGDVEVEPVVGADVLPAARVTAVAVDGDALWLAGERWIGRFVDDRFERFDDVPLRSVTAGWVRLEPDRLGGVYASDRRVLTHVDADGETVRFEPSEGFAAHGATALHLSRDHILWAASERGVTKLTSRRFATLRQVDGLLEDEVSAIAAPAPGVLVFGHNRGLTRLVDGRPAETLALSIEPVAVPALRRVMDLAASPDGGLWAVVNPLGLWRLPPGDLSARQVLDLGDTPWDALAAVEVDADGQVWLGGSGVARFVGGELLADELAAVPRRGELHVRRLHVGADDTLYAATTRHGLLIRENGTWRAAVSRDHGAPALYTVESTPDGVVWAGAEDGLYRLGGRYLERSIEPRVARSVYSLLAAPSGVLWIGTDRGAARWDGREIRHYGLRDGLAGYESNRAAATADSAGGVWLGFDHGVSRYDPRWDLPVEAPTPILDGVEVAGRFERLEGPLKLPWNHDNLVFRFRAMAFVDEGAVEYSGRLEGLEDAFSPPQHAVARRLHYASLSPGRYRLHLRARVGDGAWSEAVVSPEIRIGRPFWTTSWFFAALAALGTAAVAGVVHTVAVRLRAEAAERELAKARQLEAKNQELLRAEAQLVHAEKMAALGQLVAGVAHELNNPINFIVSGVPMMREDFERLAELVPEARRDGTFDEIRQSHGELVEAVTDGAERTAAIVDGLQTFSRSGGSDRESVDLAASLDATLRLLGHRLRGRITIQRRYADLPPIFGCSSELNQVFMNLLVNAIQAIDGAGSITITTEAVDDETVRVSVRDSGIGIDPATLGRIFDPFFTTKPVGEGTGLGLAISHGIVERHGGRIEVESETGVGTTFTVILPVHRGPEPAAASLPG